MEGLEPPHLSAYAPQAYVYTNFTTSAKNQYIVSSILYLVQNFIPNTTYQILNTIFSGH